MDGIIIIKKRNEDPTTNPQAGYAYLYVDENGKVIIKNENGEIVDSVIPLFGQEVNLSTVRNDVVSVSGDTWANYINIQINTNGRYLVKAQLIVNMSRTNVDAFMRLSKNSTDIGESIHLEMKDSSITERVPIVFEKVVDLEDGDNVGLDIATEGTSATLTVYEGHVVLWRID